MRKDRSNAEVLIRAFLSGHPVAFRDYTYQLVAAGDDIVAPSGIFVSDVDVLVTLLSRTRGDEPPSTVMMPCDVPLNVILKMAHTMTEAERLDIITSQVLAEENKRRR